ncbi:hypothetical protein [Trueperella pyogenes]|uniref:hypothetical protein n=1 Tax=Trueperella pyogenes TaxID=1661 RepID=UPI00387365AC
MKFSVDHKEFTEAVTWASRTIPNRPANAVLAGIHIVAEEDGTVTMGARDSDISSQISVDNADVVVPGEVLVNGKLLAEISRSLPDQPIEIEKDGGKFEISCGRSHFTLKTMATEDYARTFLPCRRSSARSMAQNGKRPFPR